MLVAGVAYVLGVQLRGLDSLSVAFALLGPWGAAAGIFAGHVVRRCSLKHSLLSLAGALALAPVATTILTVALAMPMVWLLRYRDIPVTQIATVVLLWWYLASAGVGVELLDRLSRPPISPSE